MSWTRGEKIAAWTLAATIASCPIVYHYLNPFLLGSTTVPENGENTASNSEAEGSHDELTHAQQEVIAAQKRRLEEKTAAAREQAIRLHEERMEERKERVKWLTENQDNLYKIGLKNECSKATLHIAVGYKDLVGDWVSRGWWSLAPGEVSFTNIVTKNPNVYFYADASDASGVEYYWSGKDKEDSGDFYLLHNGKFHLIDSEPSPYIGTTREEFFHSKAENNKDYSIQSFVCNS